MLQKLSDAQRKAIALLVEGKRDAEVAAEVGVCRLTIIRWRLHNPAFQAALNQKRRQLWDEAGDRLSALLPDALSALGKQLADERRSLSAAVAVLRLSGLSRLASQPCPTQADEILDALIDARAAEIDREAMRSLSLGDRNAEIAEPRRRRQREAKGRLQAQREVLARLKALSEENN